jgi:uncharacterized protein (DUF697 family)
MNEEVLAGIKVLVGIAKADGQLHDNERIAIQNALDGADLGADVTVESLLAGDIDLDGEMEKVRSNDAQRTTFEAACALVYVDGEAAEAERVILDKLRTAWEVARPLSMAERVKKNALQDWLPGAVTPIDDPVKRDREIDALELRASIRSAIFGAIPVPFVGEFLVSLVQIQTLQTIGALYGVTQDAKYWKAFAGNFVGATATRIAVLSLVKLVPGWGSLVGASGAFASTWAMAKATRLYFEKGQALDPAALRDAFKTAKKEGLARASEAAADIEVEKTRVSATRESLDAALAAGKIDEGEYVERLSQA